MTLHNPINIWPTRFLSGAATPAADHVPASHAAVAAGLPETAAPTAAATTAATAAAAAAAAATTAAADVSHDRPHEHERPDITASHGRPFSRPAVCQQAEGTGHEEHHQDIQRARRDHNYATGKARPTGRGRGLGWSRRRHGWSGAIL